MVGRLLVLAQFALIALLIWPWAALAWSSTGSMLAVCGAMLGVWTLKHNRLGNFNIRPEPKATSRLVTSGPYRTMRHPMYAALLLLAAAVCFFYGDALKVACWLALALVLGMKSVLEERALRQHFADYADYARRTRHRFIPGLF